MGTHSCVVLGAVGEERCGREFLTQHHGGSEDEHLADGHAAASCVVKRQRAVVNILVPEVGYAVDGGSDVNVTGVGDDGCFGQTSRSRSVNVEKLVVVAGLLDVLR